MTTIEVASRSNRLAITNRDEVCAISKFLDDLGEETDDPAEAIFAIGELPDGRWFLVDLREYEAACLTPAQSQN
jgi:hypothetical protein